MDQPDGPAGEGACCINLAYNLILAPRAHKVKKRTNSELQTYLPIMDTHNIENKRT